MRELGILILFLWCVVSVRELRRGRCVAPSAAEAPVRVDRPDVEPAAAAEAFR